jgi:hypothetical protein
MDGVLGASVTYLFIYLCEGHGWVVGGIGHLFIYLFISVGPMDGLWGFCQLSIYLSLWGLWMACGGHRSLIYLFIYLFISVGPMDGVLGASVTYLFIYLYGAYGWLVGVTGHLFIYLFISVGPMDGLWGICH